MRCTILTLFPEMFPAILGSSILGRAAKRGLIVTELVQIRDFATDKHHRVDDSPFGGGPGMVLKPDVLERAVTRVKSEHPGRVIWLSPQGKPFTQEDARRFAAWPHLILVCGHYEGVDERWITQEADEEISLGDYVLTGGELPAMVILDAVARLIPGVLGDAESAVAESFGTGLLDHPHYTRPAHWQPLRGGEARVPPTLLSGDHGAVAAWRRRQALLRTLIRRPDLLQRVAWNRHERRLIEALAKDLEAMENDQDDSRSRETLLHT
ncbi:MAG: tRNA (guanosine(37)-N1)-methyltransferase TrmD [Magnetococcales bacterium]|nr:tRNA (guanosine(37)-N1)-methyltransferase TrmD [Magnetococcales bacterium]NGZ04922.1 tRNA (guanosine(37)-N1)-methyltransferase TrmD [Magnetococcales bacterium]